MLFALIGFGVILGALTGVIGAGGGIVVVPAMVYLLGVPLHTAISTSLLLGCVGPLSALVPRLRGGVDWSAVGTVAVTGVPAAIAGSAVGNLLPDKIVLTIFVILMLVAGVEMLRKGHATPTTSRRMAWRIVNGLALGVLVGFLTGLLGVGGGFITIPALVLALRLPMHLAVGTSLAITIVNAFAGLTTRAGTLELDWVLLTAFAVPSIIVSLLVARWAVNLNAAVLKRIFAGVVFTTASLTALQLILD